MVAANGYLYYILARMLEGMGWQEECPTPKSWMFYHPTHGYQRFHKAVNMQLELCNGAD